MLGPSATPTRVISDLVEEDLAQVREERSLAPRLELVEVVQGPHHGGLHEVVGVDEVASAYRQSTASPTTQGGEVPLSEDLTRLEIAIANPGKEDLGRLAVFVRRPIGIEI